mgnify:CR=1 FL=1
MQVGDNQTLDIAMEEDLVGLSEIVVLGTRRSERTVTESPVPIDVIQASEMRQTGVTETNQLLQLSVPSFNFPRPSIADGSDHIRPATMRGLGPDQVLVLVNGKRRHVSSLVNVNGTIGRGSAGVDLNALPANAIERIEVLRDGAAAHRTGQTLPRRDAGRHGERARSAADSVVAHDGSVQPRRSGAQSLRQRRRCGPRVSGRHDDNPHLDHVRRQP